MSILKFLSALIVGMFCCPEHYLDGAIEVQAGNMITVTAYCACEKCCGKYADGYTASGHQIEMGDRFCAAPISVPLRTMLIVPGYNDGVPVPVLDRGGSITAGRLDVYFDTHAEALAWGVRELKVMKIK